MEDLDRGRVRPGFEEQQLADLSALGLDWDAPVVRQSERLELYRDALRELERQGALYYCYCSRREIREAASAPHGDLPEGAYPGTCRNLTVEERRQREQSARPPALRLRADGARLEWEDRLLGPQAGLVDDLVVRRGDGVPAYNLAVIVDDAAQGIGEVVRGADLLSSTPRQLLLARLLRLPEPAYAHVPVMLGPDGARLAKRHGAVTLRQRAALGESPRDVVGNLAAGVGLAGPGEALSPAELLERSNPEFLARLSTAGTGARTRATG